VRSAKEKKKERKKEREREKRRETGSFDQMSEE
jgi:hypothetical protein